MKKVLFFSMLACAFVACGGGNVDKVKNATLRGYDTMTISAAIEGSKICASIKYEDVSKDGLNAVKIICTESNEQIAGRNAKLEENYNVELEKYNENVKRYEKALKDAIEKNKKDRDVAIARLQDTLKKSFTKSLSYDEILKISMDNCKADAKNMTKCNNDGILSALKAAGVEESKTGFWTLKSLPSNFASVFGFKSDYYCYFHLDGCEACSYLTSKIEIKARESNNIYVVNVLVDYNVGYRRDDIIGVDNVANITFVGFPCLYYISNQKIEAIFIGVKEITNELF